MTVKPEPYNGPIHKVCYYNPDSMRGGEVHGHCGLQGPLRWAKRFVTWDWAAVTCPECRGAEPSGGIECEAA